MTPVIMKYAQTFTDITRKKNTDRIFFIWVFNNYTILVCKLYSNMICLFLISVRNILDLQIQQLWLSLIYSCFRC